MAGHITEQSCVVLPLLRLLLAHAGRLPVNHVVRRRSGADVLEAVELVRLPFFPRAAIALLLAYGRTYGARCGLESIALAASSFLNRSFSGSQYSVRFVFMAMW